LQVKLLRVLQEREFERVGDTQTIRVDTRVIAATNRELMDLVDQEKFREDLYWRLNVVPIFIPPLRMRREDVPQLVAHFLERYSEANERFVVHIDPKAMEMLQDYDWPGNVRELQNYIERAVVLAQGDALTPELLPEEVRGRRPPRGGRAKGADMETLVYELVHQGLAAAGPQEENLHQKIVDRVEKELIAQVMLECERVQTKAATRLGINRNTLHKKLDEYQIES
jgi:DNA-binding NtrC family response regulator